MTIEVALTGWTEGLQKVALTKALRAIPDIGGLASAKSVVDMLLDGESVNIAFSNSEAAHSFVRRVQSLGVEAHIKEE